jgi:hypothetical protein
MGLKVHKGLELEGAIETQFQLGSESLLSFDQHYIKHGGDRVDRMSAASKKAWLHHVLIAREVFKSAVENMTTQMRDSMYRWLHTGATNNS